MEGKGLLVKQGALCHTSTRGRESSYGNGVLPGATVQPVLGRQPRPMQPPLSASEV